MITTSGKIRTNLEYRLYGRKGGKMIIHTKTEKEFSEVVDKLLFAGLRWDLRHVSDWNTYRSQTVIVVDASTIRCELLFRAGAIVDNIIRGYRP